MRIIMIMALVLCVTGYARSQQHREALQHLRDSFPQERIHIHFDKEVYMAGETIWFKAYLFNGFAPSDLSANFITELIDQRNQVVLSKRLPIIGGTVSGNFDLPDTLAQAQYTIRAYTPWMLNFDEAYIFRKPILVYKPSTQFNNAPTADMDYRIHFFPEGGDLVAGIVNVLAFKATDGTGMPQAVTGRVLDANGSEISSFSSVHDGMGTFGFIPQTGQSYKAEILVNGMHTKTVVLPTARETGWVLQIREESDGRRRIIMAAPRNNPASKLVLIGQMQQELLLEQAIDVQNGSALLVLDTKSFPSGIMQLTLLTENAVPVAERLIFINNHDYRLDATLRTDTVSLNKRDKNVLTFLLADSITGSYSVAVTDESRVLHQEQGDDIMSRLLLTSDLKGYVHQPAYYLSANTKEVRTAVDLLMMTQGWRRFKWGEVLQQKYPALKIRDQNYVQLGGTIFSAATRKPVKDGTINFIMRTRDSLTDFFQAPVLENGRFFLDNLVYADSAQFSFQLNSKKNKEKELFIQLDKDTVDFQILGRAALAPYGHRYPLRIPAVDSLNKLYGFATDTTGNFRMLDLITVTAKKKRPEEELNKRYTTGLFSSLNMVRILDLVNNEPGAGALNVFQYIQGRIGGLRVVTSGMPPSYAVYSGRARSLTGGPIAIPLYLDESPTTSNQLASIPMSDIGMIKYFQTGFMGNAGIGTTSALAVYSKKNSDYKRDTRGFLNAFTYAGYSVTKEFYAPDYENPAGVGMPDRRATLLWLPDVKVDPETGRYKIRFFNNDSAKRIRVVMEGFTADGKLIHEEKLLQ